MDVACGFRTPHVSRRGFVGQTKRHAAGLYIRVRSFSWVAYVDGIIGQSNEMPTKVRAALMDIAQAEEEMGDDARDHVAQMEKGERLVEEC